MALPQVDTNNMLPAFTASRAAGDGRTINNRGVRISYVSPETQRTKKSRSNLTVARPYTDAYTVTRNALLQYAEEIGAEVDFHLVPVPAANLDLEAI